MRPYNTATRTLLPDRPRTRPESGAGPAGRPQARPQRVDVAWRLYQQTGDLELLRPTGTDDRIDQAWVSGPLTDAVSDYRLLDQPKGASDHHGLVFCLDTDLISRDNLWEYR